MVGQTAGADGAKCMVTAAPSGEPGGAKCADSGCSSAADRKTRIAVLVSGGGTNLQALIDAQGDGADRETDGRNASRPAVITDGEIVLVISNNAKAYALERAAKAGIPSAVVLRKELGSQQAFEAAILEKLEEYQVDFLVLAGFMTILSEAFTKKYENRIINVHPSLIPKYCGAGFYGLKVHEAVLAAGETVTGATVHYVNEIPDGGQIIMQKEVAVAPGDTPETLQRRVMEQAEWIILPQSAQMLSRKLREERKMERKENSDECI